jgi:hypothetical protein
MVVPVTGPARGLAPGGVLLPEQDDMAALVAAVVGTGAQILDVSVWSEPATWSTDRSLVIVGLGLKALDLPGAARALAAHESHGGVSEPQRSLAIPLVSALSSGDWQAAARFVEQLIGAGPGATPAGDDVLVGVLAALHALSTGVSTDETQTDASTAVVALAQLSQDIRSSLHRTTRPSAHDLAAACDGRFGDHVHIMLGALTDPRKLPDAVRLAATWGATSGHDIFHGLIAGLSTTSAYDRHLTDSSAHTRRSA